MAGKQKIVGSLVKSWLEVLARILGPVSINPDNFSGAKIPFMFPVFPFKTKISNF